MVKCHICDKKFASLSSLAKHVRVHKVSAKTYYNWYLKKDPLEGICPITGKPTKFINLKEGYARYYGKGTNSKDPLIKEKKVKTLLKNFGVSNPVLVNKEQRIEKFQKLFKDRRRRKKLISRFIGILQCLSVDRSNRNQCQICGKTFTDEQRATIHLLKKHKLSLKQYYDLFFKKKDEGTCQICGKPTTFYSFKVGYFRYCSKCSSNCPEVRHGMKKYSKRLLQDKVRTLRSQHNIEVVNPEQVQSLTSKVDLRCCKCLTIYVNSLYNILMGYGKCPHCFRQPVTSSIEDQIYNFLIEKTHFKVIRNYKGLITNPHTNRALEVDFYIPEKKVAIEIHGLYWHSEAVLGEFGKHIHLTKFLECSKKGIKLLQFFEDEVIIKRPIIESIICNSLGIVEQKLSASKCKVATISSREKSEFLNHNHIQGNDRSEIHLGLFDRDNKLVSVMTFSKGYPGGLMLKSKSSWILSRFASTLGTRVYGAASKLLNFFKDRYEWKEIITYADLRISNGHLYKVLGFEFDKQIEPDYSYFSGNSVLRIHRFELRKQPHEPKDVPEWILRQQQGFHRIWDAGKLRFILRRD